VTGNDVSRERLPREIAALAREAERLAGKGNWSGAAETVNRRLMALDPRMVSAYTRLAKCLVERGEVAEAIGLYEHVLSVAPENRIAQNRLRALKAPAVPGDKSPGSAVPALRQRLPIPAPVRPATAETDIGDGLNVLQQHLETNFTMLRAERDKRAGRGFPIFALEHGLADIELQLLTTAVRGAIRRRHLPVATPLPFVVYAAELGYQYAGEEYWQTFSARTPGWSELEDRHFIRDSFLGFADRFRGARPAGPWAEQFSIICWPITHAVLPTDLQQQLVQLIFEYRTALTSGLLAAPDVLGIRLAARTAHCSSRFRYFAQNTALLGQVAAALLVPENEASPFLSESTLKRVVDSLSAHREARRWLRDAKYVASRVRTHGFLPPEGSHAGGVSDSDQGLPPATDPDLSLQLADQGWIAYLELPDLSVLAERLPELHERLRQARVRLAGSTTGVLARRRLLIGGQRVRLDQWPDTDQPLLQLEGDGMDAPNRLLADQCVFAPGPAWLFRVREGGLATEVRGRRIRPGHSYILLVRRGVPTDARPSWISPVTCVTAGVAAFTVEPPAVLSEQELKAVTSLGIGVTSDVRVRPAGVIPSAWDGEGVAQWLTGDDVVIAVSSEHAVRNCIVSVDGQVSLVDWPQGSKEIFVCLARVPIGSYRVKVALLGREMADPVAEGDLDIRIHPPHARPPGGTPREGLVLLADPPVPTLDEIWDGRATVDLLGPTGAEVVMSATLQRANGTALASAKFEVRAPMDGPAWTRAAATYVRGSDALWERHDEADVLILAASHPDLGTAQLRCEREFAPLRWIVRRDRTGLLARLIDNTERSQVQVARFSFTLPAAPEPVDLAEVSALRWPAGGLLQARASDYVTSIVLPPVVHGLTDLQRVAVHPSVPDGPPTREHLLSLVQLASLWSGASLTGDPFAHYARRAVLRGVTARLVSDAGGGRWAQLEDRGAHDDAYRVHELLAGVGSDPDQQRIAKAIGQRLGEWCELSPAKRVLQFALVLSAFKHLTQASPTDVRFSEFLLRAASEPGTLSALPEGELNHYIDEVRSFPVLIRAARFVVLAIHGNLDDDDDTSSYRGWSWM